MSDKEDLEQRLSRYRPAGPSAAFAPPSTIPASLLAAIGEGQKEFDAELAALLSKDTEGLLVLADKTHALSADFVPADLVPLKAELGCAVRHADRRMICR